jgi:L-alanine-DL-glutamate epimerase-like enolase superfamily enzyme
MPRLATGEQNTMTSARIVQIELGTLEGTRPRHAGKNARLDDHGITIRLPIARVTADDGSAGFGIARATREQLSPLIGTTLDAAFDPAEGMANACLPIEFPLWDLMAKRDGIPVYKLIARDQATANSPLHVPCYDTSLYFDDLHLESHEAAAALIAGEAMEGWARGHRHFKIKVGRGARHMPLESGTERDILIIRAVREAVGAAARLMIDANDGYNLNLTKHVLSETADCHLHWMEEAFHEDAVLYRDLKGWLVENDLPILIADGEGEASSNLLNWAKDGLIDVVQYDIINPGLTRWLEIGRQVDSWQGISAPHGYGTLYGNYASCHLATAIDGFAFAEWDEAAAPGLITDGYAIVEGEVHVPDAPGFGLDLDEDIFARAVANGFNLTLGHVVRQ